MYDFVVMWDWVAFSVRWLHVITAMAWIGASFYFIALDLMLKPAEGMPEGAKGEPDVAQMAKLQHLAVRCCFDDDHLLDWRRDLPARPEQG